jgi:hypothetical protein
MEAIDRSQHFPCDDGDLRAFHVFGLSYERLCDLFGDGCRREAELRLQVERACSAARDFASLLLGCFDALRHHRRHCHINAAIIGADVCMHSGAGPVRITATTNSMVIAIERVHGSFGGVQVWSTLSSSPCLSSFKPVVFSTVLFPPQPIEPSTYESMKHRSRPQQIWWARERIHRWCMMNRDDPLIEEIIASGKMAERKCVAELLSSSEACAAEVVPVVVAASERDLRLSTVAGGSLPRQASWQWLRGGVLYTLFVVQHRQWLSEARIPPFECSTTHEVWPVCAAAVVLFGFSLLTAIKWSRHSQSSSCT